MVRLTTFHYLQPRRVCLITMVRLTVIQNKMNSTTDYNIGYRAGWDAAVSVLEDARDAIPMEPENGVSVLEDARDAIPMEPENGVYTLGKESDIIDLLENEQQAYKTGRMNTRDFIRVVKKITSRLNDVGSEYKFAFVVVVSPYNGGYTYIMFKEWPKTIGNVRGWTPVKLESDSEDDM